MKYLLMGGASSSILVHGFFWLYGSSGGEIELQVICVWFCVMDFTIDFCLA